MQLIKDRDILIVSANTVYYYELLKEHCKAADVAQCTDSILRVRLTSETPQWEMLRDCIGYLVRTPMECPIVEVRESLAGKHRLVIYRNYSSKAYKIRMAELCRITSLSTILSTLQDIHAEYITEHAHVLRLLMFDGISNVWTSCLHNTTDRLSMIIETDMYEKIAEDFEYLCLGEEINNGYYAIPIVSGKYMHLIRSYLYPPNAITESYVFLYAGRIVVHGKHTEYHKLPHLGKKLDIDKLPAMFKRIEHINKAIYLKNKLSD